MLAFLKEQAVKFGITPAQVFAVFAAKHWEAILSHVRDPTKETSEPIAGRIRDLQLYLHLYHALIKESEVPF